MTVVKMTVDKMTVVKMTMVRITVVSMTVVKILIVKMTVHIGSYLGGIILISVKLVKWYNLASKANISCNFDPKNFIKFQCAMINFPIVQ